MKKNIKEINENIFSNNNKNNKLVPDIYIANNDNKISSVFINVGDNKDYYENLYKYLISLDKAKYITKDNETHIHWSSLEYPKDLYDDNLPQKAKDKKRYNYRNKANNYVLEDKIIYFTGYGAKNNCKLRVPFLKEKNNILAAAHINNGHIGINRTGQKIKENGYFWETLLEDVKEFIGECPKCVLAKKGKKINNKINQIIPKGPLERVVIDGWELDTDLKNLTGFTHIVDIIDHFSKYLISIPIKSNNAQNILYCLKQFFLFVGKPKIIQSDNGIEYNNAVINNFLVTNNIKHINSSPRHPQTNGVVEIVHKEVRKNILLNFNQIVDDISFKNLILDCIDIHNNNVHSVTGFKPSFLLKNDDEEIYELVINNIKKTENNLKKEDNNNYVLKSGDHLLTLKGAYKAGKNIKCRKTKVKNSKVPLTVINNYNFGLLKVKIDAEIGCFKLGEIYYVEPKLVKVITHKEWKVIIDDLQHDLEEYNKKMQKVQK